MKDLERCDREINEIYDRATREPMPAWLVSLGTNDWEVERKLILAERSGDEEHC